MILIVLVAVAYILTGSLFIILAIFGMPLLSALCFLACFVCLGGLAKLVDARGD